MNHAVNKASGFVVSRLAAGALVVIPVYLAALLLLKAMKSLSGFLRPLFNLVPKWLPAERVLSLLLVLVICFLIGLAVRTTAWQRIENSLFQRIPGYSILRSLTQRVAGKCQDEAWKPALAEIEEALVPAFIIEELNDGRFTVFVPSSPTPVAGTVYILTPDRVHPLNIPFARAMNVLLRWGAGSKHLVAAMEGPKTPRPVINA
jgi:uncharacterized membrane protein